MPVLTASRWTLCAMRFEHSTMQRAYILTYLLLLVSCFSDTAKETRRIDVVGYQFDFPRDFQLEKGEHIDAAVGQIKGDSFSIAYGASHAIYPLIKSPEEFINEGRWKIDAFSRFTKPGISYNIEEARKIKLLQIRQAASSDKEKYPNADFIASCSLDTTKFDFGIVLPKEIREHEFKVDTINHHYRKIVKAKDPAKGETGLYLKDLNQCRNEWNCFALSMNAHDLTKQQQEKVLQIYSTVHFPK